MSYPTSVEVTTPEKMANWRPLVHWLLAIPHLIIANALGYVQQAVAIVAWFIILFTGRIPEGLARFQIMILRYGFRSHAYAGFLYDQYPPFAYEMATQEPGGSPVELSVTPALEDRNRLTVFFRLILAIPAMIFAFLVGIVAFVCWVIAFFAVLFTGHWPDGLRAWVLKAIRVGVRVQAYMLLLTDEYPPFSTD